MFKGLLWWFNRLKNPPAMQETRIQSLDWENILEKEMATHSSVLAWEIPRTADRVAWQAIVHGIARVGHDLAAQPQPPSRL